MNMNNALKEVFAPIQAEKALKDRTQAFLAGRTRGYTSTDELSVNRFDRVIAVTGFNEDGQEFSKTLDVTCKDYTQAIEQILDLLRK